MKYLKAIFSFILIVIVVIIVWLKASTWFVSSIDGELSRKNLSLIGNIEYDKVTKDIYIKQKDESYKLLHSNIDTLLLCNRLLLFSSSGNYFSVTADTIHVIQLKKNDFWKYKDSLRCQNIEL